jgi:hypothetical protein
MILFSLTCIVTGVVIGRFGPALFPVKTSATPSNTPASGSRAVDPPNPGATAPSRQIAKSPPDR